MPLRPLGEPATIEGWNVIFAMSENGSRIRCQAGGDALEDIEKSNNPGEAERLDIFNRNRATFETIAGQLYDSGYEPHVRSKHLAR